MRAVAFLVACSGCVIGEPQGTSQVWPPQLGGIVESVVAGDLDANGSTDIIVMMSGKDSQAGLYYLESDTDLIWETGDPVTTFSRFVPMALVHPVAAIIDEGAAPRVYIASGTETLRVSALANNLTLLASGESTVPGGGSAWVRPMDFPGAQPHIAVSNGSAIDHLVASTVADPRPLPAPNSPTWNLAQVGGRDLSLRDSDHGRLAVCVGGRAHGGAMGRPDCVRLRRPASVITFGADGTAACMLGPC